MKRKIRISFNSPVILTMSIFCLIATVINYISGGVAGRMLFTTYRAPLLSPMTWIRTFTHVLGHSDWSHLMGNVSYILLLGPMLEEKYSSRTIAEVIAITAFITSVVNSVFFSDVALCGASGVVFAFILLSSFTSFKEGEIPLTFILVAVIFIGQQVIDGIFIRDDISNTSHILGGIIGALIGYGLNVKTRFER